MAARKAQATIDELTHRAIVIVSERPYNEDIPKHEFVRLSIGVNVAKLTWPTVKDGKIEPHEVRILVSALFVTDEQTEAWKREQA